MDGNLKVNFKINKSFSPDNLDPITIAKFWKPIPIGYVVLGLKIELQARLNLSLDANVDITAEFKVKNNAVLGIESSKTSDILNTFDTKYYGELKNLIQNLNLYLKVNSTFMKDLRLFQE